MTKEEIIRKHKQYLFPSITTYYSEPLVTDHASMQYLWDADGKKYLDFFGGIVTISVGHTNPRVTSKVKAQIDKLQHASTLFPNEAIVALAEKIAQITPGEISQSFFSNSGTEANETAVQIARMYTGNFEVVALRHGYSGRSQLAQSLTGHGTWRKSLPVSNPGIVHALNPYCYRCPFGMKPTECGIECAKDVEAVIQTATSGQIAAFIAEPIQGVGGFITPPKEYFKIVFNIVKQYGGLFISDEVQTGWGRTGKKWFGIEQWEVYPDIITSAKGLANGTPIGLTATRPEIAGSFKGLQISTFGGNPVTSVAAKATIDLIEEDRLMDNADVVGNYFRQGLQSLQDKHDLIGDVRGMGLMQALEFVKDRKTKEVAPQETTQFMEECRSRGLLVGKGGLYGNVIRMSPPLNIAKSDVDEAIRIMDEALSAVRQPAVAAAR
ncbi:MAG: aspartate aminotransferase family protein [Acidobacteria bacterium]|nr:MAG: aspartate aminotransferase family protein [Acidobacteriota bacterium]PYX99964.1 MAG: aspartate aminotransferase family protein [Acidobacteriota bacterium]PYY24167.1 MAG: aspartate aminotransferase family protein [Acidobacteriota bacterium]